MMKLLTRRGMILVLLACGVSEAVLAQVPVDDGFFLDLESQPEFQESLSRTAYEQAYRTDPDWSMLDDFGPASGWKLSSDDWTFQTRNFLQGPRAVAPRGPAFGFAFMAGAKGTEQILLSPGKRLALSKPVLNLWIYRNSDEGRISLLVQDENGSLLRPVTAWPEHSWQGWRLVEFHVPAAYFARRVDVAGFLFEPHPLSPRGATVLYLLAVLGQGPGYPR